LMDDREFLAALEEFEKEWTSAPPPAPENVYWSEFEKGLEIREREGHAGQDGQDGQDRQDVPWDRQDGQRDRQDGREARRPRRDLPSVSLTVLFIVLILVGGALAVFVFRDRALPIFQSLLS